MDRQLACVELDSWTLFADDWFYTLWHMHTTEPAIRQIATSHRVYTDFVGDCDESYGFSLLQHGDYIRRVRVDSPNCGDQRVTIDTGCPLDVESANRETGDIEGYVDTIAKSVGIRLPHPADRVYAYGPPI